VNEPGNDIFRLALLDIAIIFGNTQIVYDIFSNENCDNSLINGEFLLNHKSSSKYEDFIEKMFDVNKEWVYHYMNKRFNLGFYMDANKMLNGTNSYVAAAVQECLAALESKQKEELTASKRIAQINLQTELEKLTDKTERYNLLISHPELTKTLPSTTIAEIIRKYHS
jgi:hypothetical protein